MAEPPDRSDKISAAGKIAHDHDPDRFLIALLAPPARREALLVLIAFNHELVRALETGSARHEAGPIGALIRLQWWREVVEGAPRRHEVAEPLAALLAQGRVRRETLLGLIDARETEAEGIESFAQWRDLQRAGPGGVQVAFAEALGISDPGHLESIRSIGAAYGAGAIFRHHRAILAAGRCPFPDDLLRQYGTDRDAVLRADPPLELLQRVRQAGQEWLASAGRPRLGRSGVAASLPAVLARRDLAAGDRPQARGLGDRLALIAASLRGRA